MQFAIGKQEKESALNFIGRNLPWITFIMMVSLYVGASLIAVHIAILGVPLLIVFAASLGGIVYHWHHRAVEDDPRH